MNRAQTCGRHYNTWHSCYISMWEACGENAPSCVGLLAWLWHTWVAMGSCGFWKKALNMAAYQNVLNKIVSIWCVKALIVTCSNWLITQSWLSIISWDHASLCNWICSRIVQRRRKINNKNEPFPSLWGIVTGPIPDGCISKEVWNLYVQCRFSNLLKIELSTS